MEDVLTETIFSARGLSILLVSLVLFYGGFRKILGSKKNHVPSMSLLDFFEFSKLRVVTPYEFIDKMLITGKKSRAAYVPGIEGQALVVWDPDYIDFGNKNPDVFPVYQQPRSKSAGSLLDITTRFGTHSELSAYLGTVKTMLKRSWSPADFENSAKRMLERLDKEQGKSINPSLIIGSAISEGIYDVIFADEPDYDFLRHLATIERFESEAPFTMGSIFFGTQVKDPEYIESRKYFDDFIEKKKEELEKIVDLNEKDLELEGFDFLARFCHLCKQGKLPEKAYIKELLFLSVAGKSNPAFAIITALYYLSKYPEIQREVREEVAKVLQHRLILENQREFAELKLCQAVITESLRVKQPVSWTVFRKTTVETKIGDQEEAVPPGTLVSFFIHGCNRDEQNFESPSQFNPYRWLTEDQEKLAQMNKAFQPFGFGQLMCPGRTMARVEVLTFLTAILNRFEVRIGNKDMSEEDFTRPKGAVTFTPTDLELIFTPLRKS